MTEFPDTKSEVLVRIRSPEDREAWEQFVSMYRPVIYRSARRRGLQDADAQDLVQRVLLSVAGSIDRWKRRDNIRFRHWLRRVTKNAVINALTRKPRDAGQGGSDVLEVLNGHPDHDGSYEREFELEARRETFHRAAALVRTEVRSNTWQAFKLTVIDQLTAKEASSRLGISVGGVYAAQARVMDRLRRVVQEVEDSEA